MTADRPTPPLDSSATPPPPTSFAAPPPRDSHATPPPLGSPATPLPDPAPAPRADPCRLAQQHRKTRDQPGACIPHKIPSRHENHERHTDAHAQTIHPPVLETPLRKDRDYRLLWTSRTVSVTGSEVSKLAVPLTAVTLLAATPFEMGLLMAAASVPALLLGLQAGAIADRLTRHRPLMIACELVSCVAALSVPLGWLFGVLDTIWLIVVALTIGTAGVLFRAANFPHLAAVVPPEQRTQAMAGFQASYSVASVSGPGLAGLLVQLLTAPFAVLMESLSFLTSALLLRSIRTPEKNAPAPSRGMWREVGEGLRVSVSNPILRALLGAGVTINFFAMSYTAVYLLYMVNVLDIPKGLIGGLTALGGIGGLLGAWITTRVTKRYGENRVLLFSVLFFPFDILMVAVISGPLWGKLLALSLTSVIAGGIVVAFATCLGAIVLRDTPPGLRGRVNATMTFGIQGVMALGSLGGGALAELLGLRPVIIISAIGIAFSTLWIWSSPLRPSRRRHRRHPSPSPPRHLDLQH